MRARTAWIALMGVAAVGVVLGIVAQSDSYNWLGSGLMPLGVSLAIIPLGTVLIRVRLARRGIGPH